jgi:hypothetical protein
MEKGGGMSSRSAQRRRGREDGRRNGRRRDGGWGNALWNARNDRRRREEGGRMRGRARERVETYSVIQAKSSSRISYDLRVADSNPDFSGPPCKPESTSIKPRRTHCVLVLIAPGSTVSYILLRTVRGDDGHELPR